ncbi:MAG TPA: OsmC family protein [bacterium]|nr:OsmC family protein [bacterium]
MSEHKISLSWKRTTPDFVYDTYDRKHTVMFAGGQTVEGSAAPQYLGKEEYANPEELLAASLSACHMLTFLAIAAKSRYVVDSYEDEATAILGKDAQGAMAVVKIVLKPKAVFSGEKRPDASQLKGLHDKAGKNCFIESSIKSEVVVEPV